MANKIYLKDGGLNSSTIPEGYIALGSDNGELKLKTGDQISSVGGFTSQIESGLDISIYSGLSKTGNKLIAGGETFSEWQVIAGVPLIQNDVYFSGSQYVYVKYIGKVVTPIGGDFSISGQKNTFTSVDTFFDTITTPFGPNGLVTNYSSTEVEPIAFAGLLIDNSTLSNEYEFWVVAVHSSEFESVVTINTTFIAPEGVEITLDRGPVPVP
jgi:hypothetical protein